MPDLEFRFEVIAALRASKNFSLGKEVRAAAHRVESRSLATRFPICAGAEGVREFEIAVWDKACAEVLNDAHRLRQAALATSSNLKHRLAAGVLLSSRVWPLSTVAAPLLGMFESLR